MSTSGSDKPSKGKLTKRQSDKKQQDEVQLAGEGLKATWQVAGAASGAVVGAAVAGPVGAVIGSQLGGALGTMGVHTLTKVYQDFLERQLSPLQENRLKETVDYACDKAEEFQANGRKFRNDGYSDGSADNNVDAAVIAEMALFRIINEPESKKRPYLANIAIEMMYREGVSLEFGIRLYNIAERLSYRQLCILSIVGKGQRLPAGRMVTQGVQGSMPSEEVVITQEILDMLGDFFDKLSLVLDYDHPLELTNFGRDAFELMGLTEIPQEDTASVIQTLDDLNKDR
jgi:hypothetical protein